MALTSPQSCKSRIIDANRSRSCEFYKKLKIKKKTLPYSTRTLATSLPPWTPDKENTIFAGHLMCVQLCVL